MIQKPGNKVLLTIFVWLWCMCNVSYLAQAQANIETFGQNRIQYRKFDWKYFETQHFFIYHYDAAGKQLARYVAEQVETDIKAIERKLDGQFPERFKIIVYNSFDDYKQSNIGRKYDSQIQDVPAGTVDLVGDKLVIYFTGVHTDLRRQIRLGMSRVVMERMLFGESFREMVKNSVLMNMPAWTVEGYINYIVDGWDVKANTDWKNMTEAYPKSGFNELAEKDPGLAGKAFWKFISDKYGESEMKNLLYAMQMKSSVNQGVKMNLGQNIKKTYDSTMAYYKEMYAKDDAGRQLPDSNTELIDIKVPKESNTIIRDIKVAPKGNDVAYVMWRDGEYTVYVQKTQEEQEKAPILEGGKKDYNEQADQNYPLLAWSNNGYKLAILYKKGTQTRIRIYNSLKAKIENYVIPPNRFDRVQGISFMEDDDNLILAAIKKSQADLYQFRIKGSRMTNITNDAWDDISPCFVSGGSRKGILFLSNRPKPNLEVPIGVNELPSGPMNVFFYNTTTKRKELVQMSHATTGTVSQPIQYGSDNYAYLYDANGIRNKYVVLMGRDSRNMDSAYAVPVTDYPRNIVSHQYNPASNQVADVLQDGDKYKVYIKPLEIPGVDVPAQNPAPTILQVKDQNKMAATHVQPNVSTSITQGKRVNKGKGNFLMKKGNVFQSEFNDEETEVQPANEKKDDNEPTVADVDSTVNDNKISDNTTVAPAGQDAGKIVPSLSMGSVTDSTYIKMKGEKYRYGFKPDFFTVRVDNSVLFSRYQPVSQNNGRYSNPSLSGMLTVGLDDLMENHRFTGGIRLPINFSGTTYFLQYENFTRRLDWGLLYLRTSSVSNFTIPVVDSAGSLIDYIDELGKNTTNMFQFSVSYPFDRIRSLKMHLGLRQDNLVFKLQDPLSLFIEGEALEKQYWGLSRIEYVFDNTIQPAMNIYNGFRYKFFTEYLYRLNGNNGGFYNFGVDFRYYHKIYKNFIWANRLAGAHSGGNQKILYFMGGVDNWINSKYSEYVPVRPTENYAFQALATNLRGYEQNARNGNTYAVLNTEFRLPVLTTFLKRPVQSSFLKNLEVVAFADMGSAWNGLTPNADALRNDRYLYSNNGDDPIVLIVTDQTGGVALGYGAGLRTSLVGYFLRFDLAWNIEGRKKPISYISIGTDF
jgi:hypothetical protein